MKRLYTLLFVLLLPAAFEFTVRLEDWVRFLVPLSNPVTSLDELSVVDSLGRHARPGAEYRQFHINALGFRGPNVPDSVLRSTPLVITSGASETFGSYETPDHEWPRQFADSLARSCGAQSVTVLNAAFAGMALPTVIQDVELRLRPLHPKLIVYYPTPSQYLYGTSPAPSPRSPRPVPVLSAWRSRALPRLRDAAKDMIPAAALEYLRKRDTERLRASSSDVFKELPMERLDSMEAHLRALVGAVRAGGSGIVLVVPQNRFADTTSVVEERWLRAWEHMMPSVSGTMLLRFGELARERVRRVAADSAVPVVDPALTARADHAALFADYLHFTDRGSSIVAGVVTHGVAPLLGCASSTATAPNAGHSAEQ